jgi:transcriptional regulator with XRE-family HTH domain
VYDSGVPTDFGSCIREWRLAASMTQRDLARRAGMDYTYLSKIEAGLVLPPSDEKIRALVTALDRDSAALEILIRLARDTKVPADIVNTALIRHPEVGALLRRIKSRRLTPAETTLIEGMAKAETTPEAQVQRSDESPGA